MTNLSNRRMRLPGLMTALALTLVAALALPGGGAKAHPLGNFTTNRYVRIELYKGEVHLHYVLDVAEIPTFQLVQRIERLSRHGRDVVGRGLLAVGRGNHLVTLSVALRRRLSRCVWLCGRRRGRGRRLSSRGR